MPRLLKTELPHHVQAFERYYALGERRTYAAIAAEMDVDVTTVKLWGRSFRWQKRIHARDLEVARKLADHTLRTNVDDRGRRRRLIDLALMKIAKAIAEDKVRYQAADLERILHLLEYWEHSSPESGITPHATPEEIITYLRSLPTFVLADVYRLMRAQLAQEFPEYTAAQFPAESLDGTEGSTCTTYAAICTSLGERGWTEPESR
jgi:hypothetical protein